MASEVFSLLLLFITTFCQAFKNGIGPLGMPTNNYRQLDGQVSQKVEWRRRVSALNSLNLLSAAAYINENVVLSDIVGSYVQDIQVQNIEYVIFES